MSLADEVMPLPPPPPPQSRNVLDPMLALARAAANARPDLSTACSLALSAGSAAVVVARRVWGDGSAPLVCLEALTGVAHKAYLCFLFLLFAQIALLLCLHGSLVFDLVLDFRKSEIGQRIRECIQESFIHPGAVFGGVAYVFCALLTVAGNLVATMSSPVDGSISMGEEVGSMMMDVGTVGMHAIVFCFILLSFSPRALEGGR